MTLRALRSLLRSRRLRALAWLAWFALVAQAFAAAAPPVPPPGGSAIARMLHGAEPAHGASVHADHAAMADSCCGGHAGGTPTHGCTCASMCASMLPVARLGLPSLPAAFARFGRVRPQRAPAMAFTPPLRPPST
ncbi:hypothetical protein ACO2Q2_12435 [Dyella sp. KRB-257]|uniref:hypothetical protein n=1 Tax=Dyella sp. KRB-257 TaxID=3400915 RepID=UPI003C04BF7B